MSKEHSLKTVQKYYGIFKNSKNQILINYTIIKEKKYYNM